NRYFSPFLAGSGSVGSPGAYSLRLAAEPLGLSINDGPTVLAADPAPGATLYQSPFVLRIDLSSSLDPASVSLDDNVRLSTESRTVPLAGSNFSPAANELQLML